MLYALKFFIPFSVTTDLINLFDDSLLYWTNT
jgi:hypothetical protein